MNGWRDDGTSLEAGLLLAVPGEPGHSPPVQAGKQVSFPFSTCGTRTDVRDVRGADAVEAAEKGAVI